VTKPSESNDFASILKDSVNQNPNVTNTHGIEVFLQNTILKMATKALEQDFINCDKSQFNINWSDPYGHCYRIIAESVLRGIEQLQTGYWSITVGEVNSHFNIPESDYKILFQFSIGRIHFNLTSK